MILTKDEILKLINEKELIIDPFSLDNLGPASYDLTLDNVFRIQKPNIILEAKEEYDIARYTEKIIAYEYTLMPGELILGLTKERIRMPNYLVGWLQGRSRFARIGLMIHVTANLVQPGVDNKQVLEIFNASNRPIKIFAGTKICQIIFEYTKGSATYEGKYKHQDDV